MATNPTLQLLLRLEQDRQNSEEPLGPPPEYLPVTYTGGKITTPEGDEVTPRVLSSGGLREGERGLWWRRGNLAYFRNR